MDEGEGQAASDHADPEELLRKIEDTGKQILDDYCKITEVDEPTMLPPAPNTSKYIDKFPEQGLSKENEGDQRQQEGYEAEVKIYRPLESLKKDIIVLQGLEYTNLQYSLFVRDHVYKEPEDRAGECDFVVIGKNFVVIIEVADMRVETTSRGIRKSFNKKKMQGERTEKLVRRVLGHINSDPDSIFIRWFCAFPSLERDTLVKRRNFKEEELARIFFKDELEKSIYNTNASNVELGIPNSFQRFGSWWELNVIDKITSKHGHSSEAFDRLKKNILGLWCMNSQNTCNPEQECSLGRSILKTDKQLNNAEITFGFGRKKPGYENPSIVEADDVFKTLGIQFLTKEQNEVFISVQKFLLINGPAGSGKTVLLLGKIVQLVQSDSVKKVVLFTFGKDKSRVYTNKLEKAGIVCETSMYKGTDSSSVGEKMAPLKQSRRLQVMIIECTLSMTTRADADLFNKLLTMATGCHVFVDDGQCLLDQYHLGKFNVTYEHHGNNVLYNVLTILRRMSSDINTTVWLLCDLLQTVDVPYWPNEPHPLLTEVLQVAQNLENTVPPEQLATLSTNLRNTHDIADVLSNIRSVLMRMGNPNYSFNTHKRIIPEHAHGHFIHGPKLVVNVLPRPSYSSGTWKEYIKLLDKMLNREIEKIYNPEGALQNTDIAILIGRSSSFLWNTAGERISNIYNIPVCYLEECHSEEWPAVIVIAELNHSIRTDQSFAKLYFAISRARTYCSIIIPRTKDNCEDCINYLCKMFVERVAPYDCEIDRPRCHQLLY